MACQYGNCSTPNSCNCAGSSYTIPSNAVYGDSTCRSPIEPCSEVTCNECVRNCHQEDKWCTTVWTDIPSDATGGINGPWPPGQANYGVQVCMFKGERLDHFLQKLALAHTDPLHYAYMVKNFYINQVTSDIIDIVYWDFHEATESMSLWVAPEDSDDWQEFPNFALGNPMTSMTFTIPITNILFSGNTYKLKIITTGFMPSGNVDTIDPASVILYVTIP
jgi:hypothetical protein